MLRAFDTRANVICGFRLQNLFLENFSGIAPSPYFFWYLHTCEHTKKKGDKSIRDKVPLQSGDFRVDQVGLKQWLWCPLDWRLRGDPWWHCTQLTMRQELM